MARRPDTRRRPSLAHPLVVAVAAWACLAWGLAASASSKASHHCACDTQCKGASCCCPSDDPPEAAAEPPRTAEPVASTPASPCVRSTPCGDPEVPATSTTRPITRLAILPGPSPAPAVLSARLRAASDAPALPPRVASRLDDPPEA